MANDDGAATLRAAREKIADPERWTKGELARAADGERVDSAFIAAEGVRWCAIGACCAVKRLGGWMETEGALRAALPDGWTSVADYNDAPTTTHADILALFDRAIAAEGTQHG